MTNETAPDRVWFNGGLIDIHMYTSLREFAGGTEYVRADALEAAQARIADLEADCSRLNEGIEAIRQFGSDTLSGPTDSSHDTRDWQRAAVKVMTWRARLLLNGYDWDAGDEEDTPSARSSKNTGKGR